MCVFDSVYFCVSIAFSLSVFTDIQGFLFVCFYLPVYFLKSGSERRLKLDRCDCQKNMKERLWKKN